jgi:hypothetical protein
MTDRHRRIGSWIATHDNGWTVGAAENPDGTFVAWAGLSDHVVLPDYLEASEEEAKSAAEFALKLKTGHERCSPRCSGWHLHPDPSG